ncbi:MAG: beta-ketoacyl synthase chain length factor [Phycisphaerales bacterium]|nr:MAG: beta-ketoacyl synthase chain length factor [Phycisphaerales bacterium]
MSASILGIGSVSALGSGVDSLREALHGSVRPRIERTSISTSSGKVELPVYRAHVEGFDRFVNRRAQRRLDKVTRMTLLAAFLALEDSSVDIADKRRVGVLVGTGFGPLTTTFDYLDTIIDGGDNSASPTLFASSVHSALASAVSIFTKFNGPCLTITNLELVSTEVLSTACAWLDRQIVDYVLVGLADESCPVLEYAARLRGAGRSDRIEPLRLDACSYLPAEGAVALLLGRPTEQEKYASLLDVQSIPLSSGIDSDLARNHRALLLAANGEQKTGRSFGQLDLGSVKVAVHSPLYGSLPVGLGFDVALAALALERGELSPCAIGTAPKRLDVLTEAMPLCNDDRLGCLECAASRAGFVSIGRM